VAGEANMNLTVLYAPCSLDSGRGLRFTYHRHPVDLKSARVWRGCGTPRGAGARFGSVALAVLAHGFGILLCADGRVLNGGCHVLVA